MEIDKTFFYLRTQKEELTNKLREIQVMLDAAEIDLINWLENNNLTQIKGPYGTLFTRGTVRARISDPDLAHKWLTEHNMQDVIKISVHALTLAAIVKDNGEFPGVEAHYETKIGVRSK